MQRSRPFSNLTPELIERILLPLNLRDRARCMMVCKRFFEVGSDGSSKLWESVACDPHNSVQMRKMLQWIWRKSGLVKRLSLHTHDHMDMAQLMSLWGLMTTAFVSLRAGLVSLDFSLPEPVELSGWVLVLTHLRWLSVCAHTIHVTDDVGLCKLLCHLHLATPDTAAAAGRDTVTFSEHSIPGSLQELSLLDVHLGALPPALATASPSLTRLQLLSNHSPGFGATPPPVAGAPPTPSGSVLGLDPLPSLTSLRCLELNHCASLAAIPQELSMLSALSELDLSFSLPADHLERLSMLTGISVLSMQGCQLGALDGSLQELLHLHTLCLSTNPDLQLSHLHGWVGRVKQLDMDLVVAARNHETLQTMTQLEVLCLCGSACTPAQGDVSPAAALAVLRTLRHLHALHLLYFKDGAHRQLVATVEALAEFAEVLRRHTGLGIQAMHPAVRNPFQSKRVTWDEVPVESEE